MGSLDNTFRSSSSSSSASSSSSKPVFIDTKDLEEDLRSSDRQTTPKTKKRKSAEKGRSPRIEVGNIVKHTKGKFLLEVTSISGPSFRGRTFDVSQNILGPTFDVSRSTFTTGSDGAMFQLSEVTLADTTARGFLSALQRQRERKETREQKCREFVERGGQFTVGEIVYDELSGTVGKVSAVFVQAVQIKLLDPASGRFYRDPCPVLFFNGALTELFDTEKEYRDDCARVLAFNKSLSEKQSRESKEQRLQKLEDQATCAICFGNPRTHAALPCAHFAFCADCAKKISGCCPFCKKSVDSFKEIFVA